MQSLPPTEQPVSVLERHLDRGHDEQRDQRGSEHAEPEADRHRDQEPGLHQLAAAPPSS